SSNMLWDITNSRLGIGGAATAKLQIATGGDTVVGEIIKANSSSQSADLLQVQNSNGTAIASVDAAGNLTTAGQIRSINGTTVYNNTDATTPATIDWDNGNVQTSAVVCDGGTISMNHMREGGSYTLIVTANATGTCVFSTSGQTPHSVTGQWKFKPSNQTPASGHTVFTILVAGGNAYVSWIEGF